MLVSVIIPTRGRPQQIKNCVRRLFETTEGFDVECVVVIDDDPLTYDVLELVDVGNPKRLKIIVSLEHHGPVWCWNYGLKYADPSAGAFVLGADDLIWGSGWLLAALSALDNLPGMGGMIGFNDLTLKGEEFASHYLVTRQFLLNEMGGVLAVPHYEHYYLDNEAGAVAKAAGKYHWEEKAVVEHRHYSYQKSPKDATYEIGLAHDASDRKIYEARKAAGWPHDYAPVLTE